MREDAQWDLLCEIQKKENWGKLWEKSILDPHTSR